METSNPTVSIVVRTKDRPVLLQRALASLAAQTYRPIEVVVVNDGGIALDEDRLRLSLGGVTFRPITLPSSRGRAHAANVGLAAAGGSFVGFLDDDDELLPRHVATLVTQSVLTASKVVYSDCETVVRELGPDGEILHEESEGRFFLSRDFSPEVLLFENYIPLICVLFSRQALEGIGGFDETLDLFEDWDFYLRVAARHPFRRVPEITARYVQWSKSSQIAFTGNVDGRAAYLRVLAKNADRIVPQALLAFYLAKQADAKASAARQRELTREAERLADRIGALEQAALDAARATGELRTRLGSNEALLDAITHSLAWKVLHTYRTRVKERLLPVGSRRRRAYDVVLSAAARRTRTVPLPPTSGSLRHAPPPSPPMQSLTRETFEPPARVEAAVSPLIAVVSVVIPTFNAGSDFRPVLRRLRDQRGLLEIEIVAVDSASDDETLTICREFGVETVAYEGEQFGHGAARMQGVARTRGEYIVFMSQDAYPVGDAALVRMARFLTDNPEVAAVSGREVPRSDADLFSCWQLWYFNEVILAYPGDTIVKLDSGGLAALTPAERRRAAQLNNVLCCVRRTAFEKIGMRPLAFAEDLDLGLRLLENGFSLGFLPSVAAVHSHHRPAAYHLRRLFADWLAQIDLLGFEPFNWEQSGIASLAEVVGGLRRFHGRLGTVLTLLTVDGTPESVRARTHSLLRQPHTASPPQPDASLGPLLDQLAAAVHAGDAGGSPVAEGALADRYGALVDEFFVFAGRLGDLAHRSEDVKGSLLNLFGHLAGWCLADCLRWAEKNGRLQPGDLGIGELLGRGV